jgi:hypothetical protein
MENFTEISAQLANLENLLEPIDHELWHWKFPFLPLLSRTLCN